MIQYMTRNDTYIYEIHTSCICHVYYILNDLVYIYIQCMYILEGVIFRVICIFIQCMHILKGVGFRLICRCLG
jgi:hypothetical protein